MSGQIFNIQDDGALVEMAEEEFANEDLFQELLAKYPNLLAGDQINTSSPRRWLLIQREIGIPSEEAGGERWSLDHLFLDQDAIPTLVEVKRSSDTRIRREVVGQMLDYAANAVVYWPVEEMRAKYELTCEVEGSDPNNKLTDFLGEDGDPEKFWEQVKTNLQAKKIRLLFVADVIPPELRRIVEFLNEITDPVEVLAVEIKHYVGQGLKTLVPRVIGQIRKPGPRPVIQGKQWDETSFITQMQKNYGPDNVPIAQRLLTWTREKLGEPKWGRGAQVGTFTAQITHQGVKDAIFIVWTWGSVSIWLGRLKNHHPFDQDNERQEFVNRLNSIPGINFTSINGNPEFALDVLKDEKAMGRFLETMEWVANKIGASK